MAKRISMCNLNASTMDILNVIRANASLEYQSLVPEVTSDIDIPKVGEVLYGNPALANQFVNALLNRIAAVKIKSATFNNAYAQLKKGYLEFGETVEEVFVGIAKAREFSAEKAEAREFKRTLPDVRSAFHVMNWRVQYPITIQHEDLRTAFLNANGVQDLIAQIINSIYTGAEYDEYLLFKYLIIKAVAHGKMYPVAFDSTDMKNAAVVYRGTSNDLLFMKKKYNAEHVTTTTAKADQFIFMDSFYNAQYDVDVLASAFNMDKATFSGNLMLIDDFTSFDNERFDVIRAESDMIEEVTADELALMADVKSVLVDREWFQVYDNLTLMTETPVGSGLYWNYFYNVWKTVSFSPFSNAIVFVDDGADIALPDTFKFKISDKSVNEGGTIFTLELEDDDPTVETRGYRFLQNADCTYKGVAVQRYGTIIMPPNSDSVVLTAKFGEAWYTASDALADTDDVGDEIEFIASTEVSALLSAMGITNVQLNTTFDKNTFTYTGTTNQSSGTLTFTQESEYSSISGRLGSSTLTLDGTGTTLNFEAGANVLLLAVSGYKDGATVVKTYKITITKS